jgi:hypothetical protein
MVPKPGLFTENALERSTAVQTLEWILRSKDVQVLALRTFMLSQEEEVFKKAVVANRFRPALLLNELEFCDASIGFEVERPASISGAQRDVLNCLSRFQKDQDVHPGSAGF